MRITWTIHAVFINMIIKEQKRRYAMIGEKVTIRVRMSMHDAHYAGNLVNGSRMLDYFGSRLCR